MDDNEYIVNEYDEAECYIRDDDGDAVSLGESEESDVCEEDCKVCEEPTPTLAKNEDYQKSSTKNYHSYIYKKKLTDSVNNTFLQKMAIATKIREELYKCKARITELEQERDNLYSLIKKTDDLDDVPNGDRLRAQHNRAITELEMEHEIELAILTRLKDSELELAQAELEKGKYQLMEDDIKTQRAALQQQKQDDFLMRKANEDAYVNGTFKKQEHVIMKAQKEVQDLERRERVAYLEAKAAQEKNEKYLKSTMKEIREKTRDENERHSAELNRRIAAALSLKRNITTNKENIDAIRARNRDILKEEEKADKEFMDEISAQGGDPEIALLVKKRKEQMEKSKMEHEIKKKETHIKIAEKLIYEEERINRRKQMYPHLWQEKEWEQSLKVKPHKKKKLKNLASSTDYEKYIARIAKMNEGLTDQDVVYARVPDSSDEENENALKISEKITDSESIADNTNLAKPEFEGMWNKFQRYVVPKEVHVGIIKGENVSKMDQDIMRVKLEKQRENIVQKQVAAGRVFDGKASYNCKPSVVHFKDFDIGKSYKVKVILTNVSYSINFCKFIDLSDQLKDFIEIDFVPPGQMSAGMTCELLITFKPMINEDLNGVLNFLSQTGPFELPVICSTKKCDLSVNMTEVQFGTSVIGETLTRHITLTNNGALGTRFMFGKYTGKDHHIVTAKSPEFTKKDTIHNDEQTSENLETMSAFGNGRESEGGFSKGEALPELTADQSKDAYLPPGSAMSGTIGADLSETHDLDLDGMMVSENNATYIKPFSQEKLEIIWRPTVPGKCDAQFILSFEDEFSKDITLTSSGTSIDVPVYVTRQSVDLQICMYDRLYQDSIVVKNRAKSALKLTFDVPKCLRKHMELLPKTGFVQAQSAFSAQLKFLPRETLAEDAPEYFDPETGVLEVPLLINVADQTRPVPFTVHAIVTNSDLEFNMTEIDFGHCTIYESVRGELQLTNKSILPQEFGFIGLPDYIDIQPNDGFGIVLPKETITLDVIFGPSKAENYSFELCCKSLINRSFKIRCKGVGVHPPLELSHQLVDFKATSLNDYAVESIYVINNHLSANQYTHPVPRIGKGSIVPVGPTSFEFKVPEDSALTLYPSVGTIKPGEKMRVQVRFAPTLPSNSIKKEAVRIMTRKAEEKAKRDYEAKLLREKQEAEAQALLASAGANVAKQKKPPPAKPSGKASPKPKTSNRPHTGNETEVKGPEPVIPPDIQSIQMDSDEYASAQSSLFRQFEGSFHTYVIPCYVASGVCGKPGQLPYSIHNTLYLEVRCPAVKPQVVVLSNNGRMTVDYGDISIGQQMNKTITIQNISDKEIPLTSSLLDTTGPFEMRNPLRELPPDSSHSLIIRFAPLKPDVFQETLHIYAPHSTLHVNLLGRGVNPTIQLNIDDKVFDMGAVLVNEYVERTFKIKNTSSLAVDYMIKFDSLSQLRHKMIQELPAFVRTDGKRTHTIGVQNFNGKCVFDCVPCAGSIPGGGTQEITLTFAPDHASDFFSDGVHIELFNGDEAYSFQVIGQAKEHIMYVGGGEIINPNIESLTPSITLDPAEEAKPIAGNVLLMFYSIARDGVFSTATADLAIGCVRTMAVSQRKETKSKKNGEYSFENMNALNAKGFTIAEPKSYLEAGTKKNVTVSWTPVDTHNPDIPIEASIIVTTKCDITENYQVLLRGIIISRPEEQTALHVEDITVDITQKEAENVPQHV